MKTMSKLALAAALSAGVAAPALISPALAAKKEEPKGPKLSPEFLKPAQAAKAALDARDYAGAEPLVAAAEAAAKTDDDKYTAVAFRYQLEQNKIVTARQANPNAQVDESKLAAPLTALLASDKPTQQDKANFAMRLGQLNYNSKQWAPAIRYLQQAQQLGNTDENIPLLIAQAQVESGDVNGGLASLDQVIQKSTAAGQKAPESYYRYAITKTNAAKLRPQTLTWLTRWVAAYPTQKNWRDVALLYGLSQGSLATLDKSQRIDLFRLMRATKSLADQSLYEEYAQAAMDKGLPTEAVGVIQEGIAAGKLQAASANIKAGLAAANAGAKAEGSLSALEAKAKAGANGALAAQTGDAYLSQGNWAKSVELYKLALSKGGVNADEVNTHLGIALARSGDKAGAQAAFAEVKGAPRVELAQLWTAYLNQSPTAA